MITLIFKKGTEADLTHREEGTLWRRSREGCRDARLED